MASPDEELEEKLMEVGNGILEPPSAVGELLPLLDQVESYLSTVDQSPSKSMLNALGPSMKALVNGVLLRHSDMDVKVAVASCISEITRITAPDAPYDDDQMKEIFQMIVASFENLFDTSSRSYPKRVSILETVANVRSCVVMLDLECDDLILKMFNHFLKAIRDNHSDSVFSSMEIIMTMVLEESEDISFELLSSLLTSVKKQNQHFQYGPAARRLGEKVIGNCAGKLKPYLLQAVNSMDISLNNYSKIVASVCRESFDVPEHNDLNISDKQLGAEGLEAEAVSPEEIVPAVLSNGTARSGNSDTLIDPDSPKKPEPSCSNQCKSPVAVTNSRLDQLDSAKIVKETVSDEVTTKTGLSKTSSSMLLMEASDHPEIDCKKEAAEQPSRRKGPKEADNPLSEGPSIMETVVSSEHEMKIQPLSPTRTQSETAALTPPSAHQSKSAASHPKRGRPGRRKKGRVNAEAAVPGSPSESKGNLSSDLFEHRISSSDIISTKKSKENNDSEEKTLRHSGKKVHAGNANEDETPKPMEVDSKKESDGDSDSKSKQLRQSGEMVHAANADEDETPLPMDIESKKESEGTSDLEAKPLSHLGKKVHVGKANEGESSVKQHGDKTLVRKGKTNSEKGPSVKSSKKKMVSSPKSAKKVLNKDQSHSEESPKEKSKRKRILGTEESSEKLRHGEDLGENLVSSKIKVWWPADKMFYEGVVDSFDPIEKKHKILYVDGDEEILLLREEKWEFVGGGTFLDGVQEIDLSSPNASSEMPQKKKAKTSSDSSSKQEKTDAPQKRGEVASTGKSKGGVTKSAGKSKDDASKPGIELKGDATKPNRQSKDSGHSTPNKQPRQDTPKTSRAKSKDVTPKSDIPKPTIKSKDDTLKTSSKSKDDSSKSSSKSKDNSSKSGSKFKDDSIKIGSKSKDGSIKIESKSKDLTPKLGKKVKTQSPKTGSKSDANGISTKGKSSSSKIQESGDSVKGKSDTSKVGEAKSGKKRRKGSNGDLLT